MKLDDSRWQELEGGYKVPYNPVPALRKLEQGDDVWDELWDNLHHQGDVGVASYAAVTQLVRIGETISNRDWNFYGLISAIDVERHRKTNPLIPDWLEDDYYQSMAELLKLAQSDLEGSDDRETTRSILGILALCKGDLKLGALITKSDSSEIDEMLDQYDTWSETYKS